MENEHLKKKLFELDKRNKTGIAISFANVLLMGTKDCAEEVKVPEWIQVINCMEENDFNMQWNTPQDIFLLKNAFQSVSGDVEVSNT